MPGVALYGNSMVLAGISARLERRMGLHTVTIDPGLPGALERLSELQADVVLLDVGTAYLDPVVAFWKARPEVLLIGVDLDADRMLILSGQPARALRARGLIEALADYKDGPNLQEGFKA
jgi:hypothetical protein